MRFLPLLLALAALLIACGAGTGAFPAGCTAIQLGNCASGETSFKCPRASPYSDPAKVPPDCRYQGPDPGGDIYYCCGGDGGRD